MHLSGLDSLLWAAGFAAHVALLFVLWFRRRAPAYPFFTTFITAQVVEEIVLYLLLHFGPGAGFFYTYWSLAIIDVLLKLCVVYEISARIFRPLGSWAKDVRGSFLWFVGISLAMAGALAWLADPHTRFWVQVLMIRGSLFAAVLFSELFVAMISLSVTVGLPWKAHAAKIAQGLGIYSVVRFLTETGNSYFGMSQNTRVYHDLSQMRIAVYIACVVYWMVTLWRDAPPPRELPDQMYRELFALQGLVGSQLQSLRSRRR